MAKKQSDTVMTANDFVNVLDIRGNTLYTKDGLVFTYVKVEPISIELYSKQELSHFLYMLVAEFSSEKGMVKLLSIDRSSDVEALIENLQSVLNDIDSLREPIRRTIIAEEMQAIMEMALGDKASEKEFYYVVWEKDANEALKRANDIVSYLTANKVSAAVCSQEEIYQLCNACANPLTAYFESNDSISAIPMLRGGI